VGGIIPRVDADDFPYYKRLGPTRQNTARDRWLRKKYARQANIRFIVVFASAIAFRFRLEAERGGAERDQNVSFPEMSRPSGGLALPGWSVSKKKKKKNGASPGLAGLSAPGKTTLLAPLDFNSIPNYAFRPCLDRCMSISAPL